MLTSQNGDAMAGISDSTSLTPRRAQKRLFNSGTSSIKRNLFREIRTSNNTPGEPNSGDDSDIGPMSPLALSDTAPNSATNSPRRRFDSPLASAAADGSSVSLRSVDSNLWEIEKLNDSKDGNKVAPSSPFSALKMLTKIARNSQRRLGCRAFSELSITATENNISEENVAENQPKTPEPPSLTWNESITETPKRIFGKEIQNNQEFESKIIAESPQKDSPVKMLITPLGSVSKEAPLPRFHHRKSLGNMALYGSSSPTDTKENGLKRTACPLSAPESSKLSKLESCPSIPKARAALFQERKEEFKLSTKLFYHTPSPDISRIRKSPLVIEKVDLSRGLKRPAVRASRISRGRTTKRRRYGEINAGIGHCVKRPKLKKPLPHMANAAGNKVKVETVSPHREAEYVDKSGQESAKPLGFDSKLKFYPTEYVEATRKEYEQPPDRSAEVDPGKKFFKTNRTLTRNIPATVTVNNTIKLQVSNGKLKLQSNEAAAAAVYTNPRKKARGLDFALDANDLTVDDPKFEASAADGTNIDNILRVLEEDWADDEYDTLEALVPNARPVMSPKSQNLPSDVTMSPASELSSMTSIMNIKDAGDFFANVEQMPYNSERDNDENESKKFYPLFNKDFKNQSKINTIMSKKIGRGVKRTSTGQFPSKSLRKDDRQYQLDAGQKLFGAIQCPECGIVYQIGDPDDENSHRNYHESLKILKFAGWKHERIVSTDDLTSSRIILVEPGDPKHCWKKVTEILAVVDRDLGLAESRLSDYCNDKIYLYVRDKEIIGVLAAEYVTAGYRMIPGFADVDCCSLESSDVKCGVKVVWTTMSQRKQGIATKLMDVLRATFHFGYIMSKDDIAFSIPTPGGKAFAEKYANTKSFKVYS